MYRLFQRGHLEEARFVSYLVGIGFEVKEIDAATQKQFRISGAKGHFGGSLDALMKAPASYGLEEDLVWLGEFKTHSEKSFLKLQKDGVIVSKPQHYSQMSAYGRAYNLKYGLYCAVNKNNDDLYIKIIELNWRLADDLFRKAESIIFARQQPPKIAQTEAFFDCKYCDFKGICHAGKKPEINCRSCRFAIPVDNGEWYCERLKTQLSGMSPCEYYERIV